MTTDPEISVVVPTFGHTDMLASVLGMLARQTLDPDRFDVIVVDDCSTDTTVEDAERLSPTLPYRLRVLRTPVNGGPAAARNLGWREATAPLVAFLDDDCTTSDGWLEAGLTALAEQEGAGVIQGRTHTPGGISTERLQDWLLWRIIEGPTAFFEGCNIFYRRRVLEVTGGFDEDIRYYGEDCAAGWRALEAGFGQGYAPDASVSHPVEHRGFKWFLRNGFQENRLVACGAKHPGFRQVGFWRPWAYRREDPAFVLAMVGLLAARRWRPALLLVLPYVWWQRPSVRSASFFRLCLQIPVVDAARLVGHLKGSWEHRVFVI